jgi:hypothetical protein
MDHFERYVRAIVEWQPAARRIRERFRTQCPALAGGLNSPDIGYLSRVVGRDGHAAPLPREQAIRTQKTGKTRIGTAGLRRTFRNRSTSNLCQHSSPSRRESKARTARFLAPSVGFSTTLALSDVGRVKSTTPIGVRSAQRRGACLRPVRRRSKGQFPGMGTKVALFSRRPV